MFEKTKMIMVYIIKFQFPNFLLKTNQLNLLSNHTMKSYIYTHTHIILSSNISIGTRMGGVGAKVKN